ncbi:hypothetical protein RHECNPAF_14110058 [Rhizobium etli CNPAF512]|nr:hypothetical protein RHECNPAF_14110058 [Rhizobium etli CNPAF512]
MMLSAWFSMACAFLKPATKTSRISLSAISVLLFRPGLTAGAAPGSEEDSSAGCHQRPEPSPHPIVGLRSQSRRRWIKDEENNHAADIQALPSLVDGRTRLGCRRCRSQQSDRFCHQRRHVEHVRSGGSKDRNCQGQGSGRQRVCRRHAEGSWPRGIDACRRSQGGRNCAAHRDRRRAQQEA